MMRLLWIALLLMLATTSVEAQAPAASAQWSVDSGAVRSLNFNRLYNTRRGKHLSAKSSGDVFWATEQPGFPTAFFENCTRPGEVVYGSDKVALRYGVRFLIATGPSARGWTLDRQVACQFRLIPSGAGLVPAGSGNGQFAIYNMSNKRYLVYNGDSLACRR